MRAKNSDPKTAAEYNAAVKAPSPTEAKRKIREAYIKTKYANLLRMKTWQHSYATIDAELGKYMNYGQTVAQYGGWPWPEAPRAARRVFAKCFRMGGKWTHYDGQSELVECLILGRQRSEILEQK